MEMDFKNKVVPTNSNIALLDVEDNSSIMHESTSKLDQNNYSNLIKNEDVDETLKQVELTYIG